MKFWCGVLFAFGVMMCIQDFLGLEQYITYVRAHWTDMHPMVGALIALVARSLSEYVAQ
jgi:hypothetical protein